MTVLASSAGEIRVPRLGLAVGAPVALDRAVDRENGQVERQAHFGDREDRPRKLVSAASMAGDDDALRLGR